MCVKGTLFFVACSPRPNREPRTKKEEGVFTLERRVSTLERGVFTLERGVFTLEKGNP